MKIDIQKLKCKFGFHSYGKWEFVEEGDIVEFEGGIPVGKFIRQKRICSECGFIKLKTSTNR